MQVDLNNRKLLKEWNKVKDFDIFQDINEFALLFYEKPYGICMRKYTSYPWCKENFFFGSYDELKEWYQTTDEIPFYVKEVVGQKLGRLTVLDFLYKHNSKGIRTLHAKCKCDCGNTVEADYRNLKHGDIVSCGCRVRNKEPQIIKPLTEKIIEFWDFDKNAGIDPYKISQMSTEKFWWKDNEGNSYQLAPYVFAKEDKTNSSFPEQALFYYIKKEYSSAINRANFITADGEILEIDIFIPAYNIGIEYDGVFWHKNKAEADTYKSNVLRENGIYLIRIREDGLSDLSVKDFIINQCPYNSTNEFEFVETLNQTLELLRRKTNRAKYKKITYEEFTFNRNSIYALIYNKSIKNSIKDTCISRFWDKKRNGDLQPECVSINSNVPIFFKCVAGYSLRILANTFNYKIDKAKDNKHKLFNCVPDFQTYKCKDNQCCPFANLDICQGGINCFNKGKSNYPKIECLDKGVSLNCQKSKQYLLRFCLYNNSIFELHPGSTGAILIGNNIERFGNMSFVHKAVSSKILPKERRYFDLQINNSIRENIPNCYLIVYQEFFRPIVDNRGWFLWSIIVLSFDELGNIKRYKSGLYSKNEGARITNYYNSVSDFKSIINKIFSEEI